MIIASLEIYSKVLSYNDDIDIKNMTRFKYLDKNTVDVVCLGSSGMITCNSPNLAWKKGNFTSYIYGSTSLPTSMYKYLLQEVRKTQNPDLFIIEIETICFDDDAHLSFLSNQRVFDALPFSINKAFEITKMFGRESDQLYFYSLGKNHYNYPHFFL